MSISLLVASADEHFRETIRENLLNIPNSKVAGEFPEVGTNLYIRVLQALERNPEAALFLDMAGDPETALKALEKVKQAAPDLYIVASSFGAEGETVLAAMRAGANDFLPQPLRRIEFRECVSRLERTPRRVAATASKLGKVYAFLGTKGGVGTTALATNFAAILAQRKQQVVLMDLDWVANDVAMQLGASPQYTLLEVADNLSRMDQALFEGFVTRDPLGFFLIGPPDSLEQRAYLGENAVREFTTFLVEHYDSVVIDCGRNVNDEVVLGALHSSTAVFLVVTQSFPSIRNAQRYLAFLMRTGFNQDQIKLVVNQYQKKPPPHMASPEQVTQTLNMPIFYGIPPSPAVLAAINRSRPVVADRQAAPELDKALRAFADKATGRQPVAKSA